MGYCISNVAHYVPEKVVDNEIIAARCGVDRSFLEDKIGIKERRVADDDEVTSFMACRSARRLIERGAVDPQEIDALIVCTQNPDYRLPTTACLVQDMLGLKKSIIAFDINLGCSGFVYALPIAGNFIRCGAARGALVIMADQYSKIVDPTDKNTASVFGDASAAILLRGCEEGYGVVDGVFGTDGAGAKHLILYNSGVRKDPEKSSYLFMDGREIFKFSVSVVPDSVKQLLKRNGLELPDVKHYLFHQANLYMLREIKNRLGLRDDQMVIDMEHYGNTVSASIPIAYSDLIEAQPPARGDLAIFCGFGVGLSWGAVLYRFC